MGVGLKVINMKGTITFMYLTTYIFFITFSNIEGRGRNFCKFQSTTQCPLGSKYIEIVIPTNNTCPDANFIYFPGGFGHFLFGRKDFDEPGSELNELDNEIDEEEDEKDFHLEEPEDVDQKEENRRRWRRPRGPRRRPGRRWGRRNICSTSNPTGTTLAPSTLKTCSYCRSWLLQNVTALNTCDLSCNGMTVICTCQDT